MINMKAGKTRSAGVNPSHFACFKGAYAYPHAPALLTRIMPQMVIPLNTSNETNRLEVLVNDISNTL